MHKLDPRALRAAWWTLRSLRLARRQLRANGLNDFQLPAPPDLPIGATRGVNAVLRRVPQTCLERAMVLQRWHAAHGEPRDVVIAVRGAATDFRAHAWVDGEPDERLGYEELMRVSAL